MEKEILVKENHLNGCFGDLYMGGNIADNSAYFRCVCDTQNVSSDKNDNTCIFCPFKDKKIKLVNYDVQKEGIGFAGKEELGESLKQEL